MFNTYVLNTEMVVAISFMYVYYVYKIVQYSIQYMHVIPVMSGKLPGSVSTWHIQKVVCNMVCMYAWIP